MNTLRDINIYLSKKQKGWVNNLIEKNPIIDSLPMKAASHGFYNVFPKVTNIDPLTEVDFDAELPLVGIGFEMGRTNLGKIGGKLPMPQDAAREMGGYSAYAQARVPLILGASGNTNEARIYYRGFLKSAINNGRALSCKGDTPDKQYSMAFVHYDEDSTIGLLNKNTLSKGKLFEQLVLNGGNEYEIEYEGDGGKRKCIGKMMAMYMEMGLQLADPNAVAALVNIEPTQNAQNPDIIDGLPTRKQIEDCLGAVRADTFGTYIYAHPTLIGYLAVKYQLSQRTVTNETGSVHYSIIDWNGVPMIGSYNIKWGKESVIPGL